MHRDFAVFLVVVVLPVGAALSAVAVVVSAGLLRYYCATNADRQR
jgi:Flp pilus assembly protein TadB